MEYKPPFSITAILNGKRILGAPQEIQEVKNAYEAYEILLNMNPYSVESLLSEIASNDITEK